MYNRTTIGTCSICGGEVQVPTLWSGVIPPTPTCSNCGAVQAKSGPVIPMIPNPYKQSKIDTGTGQNPWLHKGHTTCMFQGAVI